MSVFNRYVLAQVARPTIATILIALVALLAERTLRVVDLVVGWRGSVLVVFEMLGYLVPHYMGLAIPVAFFLGVLLTFDRLSKEAELAAIYASGTGLGHLLRPLLLASVFLMVLTTALASYLQPFGRYAYRAASYALTNASFYTLLQNGVFTTLGRSTYRVEVISPDKQHLEGVFVYTEDQQGNAVTITAKTGDIHRQDAISPIELRLRDGVQQVVPAGGEDDNGMLVRFRNFATAFGGQGDDFRPRGEDEREMTLPELWGALGSRIGDIRPAEIDAEFHGRVVRILSLPVLPFLAIPLALGRIRGQRSYGLVIGIGVLIGYHQVLQFGEALVDDGRIPGLVGLWIPYAGFCALSLWLFARAATRVPDPKGAPWLDRVIDTVTARIAARFRRRPSAAGAGG